MKKLLLSAALLSAAFGFSQNLIQNPTADFYTLSTSDNADAFDMTPPSGIDGGSNNTPYAWNNTALFTYLDNLYFVSTTGNSDNIDEQPATTSDGFEGSRGLKLTEDNNGDPTVSGVTRRVYQRVDNLSTTDSYTFTVDTRSETATANPEIFILNEEITTEVGLENGVADSRVDAYFAITNDVNPSNNGGTNFTTNSFSFTPSATSIVVYMRALGAVDNTNEVFVDNLSLVVDPPLSSDDFTINGSSIGAGPVPMTETLNISGVDVDSATIYSLGGAVVATGTESVDVAGLAAGVYVLEVTSGSETATTMVVK